MIELKSNRGAPTLAGVVNSWQMNTDTMGVYSDWSMAPRESRQRPGHGLHAPQSNRRDA
jgi:hypothetical protein